MAKYLLALFVTVLVLPNVVSAAYLNRAEVLRYEQGPHGDAQLVMRFRGNAGEPIVDRPWAVTGPASTAMERLRNWVAQVAADLNVAQQAGKHPSVADGTIITGLASSAVPQPPQNGVVRKSAGL